MRPLHRTASMPHLSRQSTTNARSSALTVPGGQRPLGSVRVGAPAPPHTPAPRSHTNATAHTDASLLDGVPSPWGVGTTTPEAEQSEFWFKHDPPAAGDHEIVHGADHNDNTDSNPDDGYSSGDASDSPGRFSPYTRSVVPVELTPSARMLSKGARAKARAEAEAEAEAEAGSHEADGADGKRDVQKQDKAVLCSRCKAALELGAEAEAEAVAAVYAP